MLFTPPVACKGIAIAFKRNSLKETAVVLSSKKIILPSLAISSGALPDNIYSGGSFSFNSVNFVNPVHESDKVRPGMILLLAHRDELEVQHDDGK